MKRVIVLFIAICCVLSLGWISLKSHSPNPPNQAWNQLIQAPAGNTLDLRNFQSDLPWDELLIVAPWTEVCLTKDQCFSSYSDSEAFVVLSKNNQMLAQVDLDPAKLQFKTGDIVRIPREYAVFKRVDETAFAVADNSFLELGTLGSPRVVLHSPVGHHAFCKVFLTGNGACDFDTLKDCEKLLKADDEACLPNKIGAQGGPVMKFKQVQARTIIDKDYD